MEPNKTTASVVDACTAMREQARENYTVPQALDDALWLRRTPDAVLSPDRSKQIIATLLAYDRAGHYGIQLWAQLAEQHGARPEKYASALAMVTSWERRTDLRWPT